MNIFRYSAKDTYLFMYTTAMVVLPVCIALYTTPNIWWLLFAPFHAYLLANLQNTSLHHQSHWPMFVNNRWNEYYEIFTSASSGLPYQHWKYAHTLHHKYVNDKPETPGGDTKDPVSVFKFSTDGTPINFWVYTVWNARFDLFAIFRLFQFARPGMKKNAVQYKREQIAIKVFFVLIALINFYYVLALLATYYLGYAMNRAISYGEHWTVHDRRGDTTQDSVNSYNKLVNWLGFGAGMHQEHHHRPGVHWSQYATVTPLLHPNRKIVNSFPRGLHISNNPFWGHFKELFKKKSVS